MNTNNPNPEPQHHHKHHHLPVTVVEQYRDNYVKTHLATPTGPTADRAHACRGWGGMVGFGA